MTPVHSESNGFRSLTRYEDYYLPGGDLFLLVENHVFRVHRYFFERESIYFKGKLATPASPGSTRPGTSESNAILLDDVRVHEFARFLWVFYNPKYSLYRASVADWVAILTLAHRWGFPEVKALSIRELEKHMMPDIDRVVVYQDNEVDRNLLIRCYTALIERDEPISPAEGRRMGIETALTIAQLREVARRSPVDCRSPTPTNFRGSELFSLVRELFGIAPPSLDGSVPPTPLGGPTPLWLPSPQTVTREQRSTATPLSAKVPAMMGTAPPIPPRTLTPPQPVAPATEPLTPRQEVITPPPPPPAKPERPQIITGQKQPLGKAKQGAAQSRASTPGPETPTMETPNPEKKAKKRRQAKKQTETTQATGSLTPKTEENPNAPEEKTQLSKEEEKKDEVQVTPEAETKDSEEKDDASVLQEGEKAGTSVVPEAVPADEKKQATTAADGESVSTDTSNPPPDPAPVVITRTDSKGSTLASHDHLENPFSPIGKPKGVVINRNEVKSPMDKSKSSPLFNSIWGSLTNGA